MCAIIQKNIFDFFSVIIKANIEKGESAFAEGLARPGLAQIVMVSKNFATKTIFDRRESVTVPGYFPIAIDIGYSSVNVYSPKLICSFPAFARKLKKSEELLGTPSENEIIYRDDVTGEEWRVGEEAQKTVSSFDTNDSVNELYGRNRYSTPIFKVLLRTALGLALIEAGGSEDVICVQTGLPPAYLDEDTNDVKAAFSGCHTFSLKIGNHPYMKVRSLSIDRENVSVMSQPKGTLISVTVDNNAHPTENAALIVNGNAVVFDGGFGTLDLFELKNRMIDGTETFSNYGMKAVFERFCEKIRRKYGTVLRVPAIQPILQSGKLVIREKIPGQNRYRTNEVEIADILEESSKEICQEAVDKMMSIYNGLRDDSYLIVTGGTGAAWKDYILEAFADDRSVTVVLGNANSPDLDIVFANVRGYYMTLINSLKRRAGKTGGKEQSAAAAPNR